MADERKQNAADATISYFVVYLPHVFLSLEFLIELWYVMIDYSTDILFIFIDCSLYCFNKSASDLLFVYISGIILFFFFII